MAGVKISQLPVGSVSDDDALPIVDSGNTRKVTIGSLKADLRSADGALDSRLDAVEAKNTQQDGRLDAVEAKNTAQDLRLDDLESTKAMMLVGFGANFMRNGENETPSAAHPSVVDGDGYWTDGSKGRISLISRQLSDDGKSWIYDADITHDDSGLTLRLRYGLAGVVV